MFFLKVPPMTPACLSIDAGAGVSADLSIEGRVRPFIRGRL